MAAVHPEEMEKKMDDLVFVPGKAAEDFRVYDMSETSGVRRHYRYMRTNQSVEFVDRMYKKWHGFNHASLTVKEAFDMLENFVDASDPDTSLPNLVHMMQTAERARQAGEPEWFQLICLIHDMGKAMCLVGGVAEDGQANSVELPQYAIGGDTWVVGCRIPDCTVYPDLNAINADMANPAYNTENGVYTPGCGMMALKYAYGHDEYMYRFVLHNKCLFPEEGLAMLRLHSCYPWHRGGAYRQFMKPGDEKLLEAVLRFNQYDLYSKGDEEPDVEKMWPYYQGLVEKFMPGDNGKLQW